MKIALVGKMGSGKTTAAKHLVEKHGFVKLSFADPVKIVTAQMLNQLQAYLHVYGVGDQSYVHWTLDMIDQKKVDPAIRHLIQFVGTELGREYIGHDRIWIDILLRDAEHLDKVVVDDVRFKNEGDALTKAGFKLIHINKPGYDIDAVSDHISERQIDAIPVHASIENMYSQARFLVDVDFVLKRLSQENTRS